MFLILAASALSLCSKLADAMRQFLEQTVRPYNDDWYDKLTHLFTGRDRAALGNIAAAPSAPLISLRQLSKYEQTILAND